MPKKRIYLDYASTTPVDKEVLAAMTPYFSERFENPSSLYREGVATRKAVEESRTKIARILECRSEEIYFTGSGTEANNLAILGVFRATKNLPNPPFGTKGRVWRPHFVTTTIEHPSVLEVFKQIEREGGEVTYVRVGESGIVNPKDIAAALKKNTVLVSVMYANNEIGTIQPLSKIAREIRDFRKPQFPIFHTDASQAANYLSLNISSLGVDMMTLDASKIYGPKGVGMLFKKRNVEIQPIIFGGGQERGLRAGTENVAGIVGMAKALELAAELRTTEVPRLLELRDLFISEVLKKFSLNPAKAGSGEHSAKQNVLAFASLNGDLEARLPNNINICFPNLDAEFAVISLDEAGIACSSTTACKSISDESFSHVIASTAGNRCASSSLRFTLGRSTTKADIEKALRIISKIL